MITIAEQARRFSLRLGALVLPDLPVPASAPLAHRPLEAELWDAVTGYCHRERLTGLLIGAATSERLPVTDQQASQLADLETQLVRKATALTRAGATMTAALNAAGIEHRILKGLASCRLEYPDPLWRPSNDVDVLIHRRDARRAAAAIDAAGLRGPEDLDRSLRREDKSYVAHVDLVEIDVHHRPVAGPSGFLAGQAEDFGPTRTFDLGGIPASALDRATGLVHASLNTVAGDWYPRPLSVLDVALLARNRDADAILEAARRWQAQPVVAQALRLAGSLYGTAARNTIDRLERDRVSTRAALALWLDDQSRRTQTTRFVAELVVGGAKPSRLQHLDAIPISRAPMQNVGKYLRRSTTTDPRLSLR